MTTLRELELELAWLTKKLAASERRVADAEAYFKEHSHRWSKGVTDYFLYMLERKKDQLYYEQHRHEKLAWKVILERDARKP